MKRWNRVKRRNLLRWLLEQRLRFAMVQLVIGGEIFRQLTWIRQVQWFDIADKHAKRRLGEPE